GHLAEGTALLERALREFEGVGMRVYQGRVAADLAEAYVRVGRTDEAATQAEPAIGLARERGQSMDLIHAPRALGAVAAARGDVQAAIVHYDAVVELGRQLGLRPLQALCHLDLARVYRHRDPARATDHQTRGDAMCRDVGMRFWVDGRVPAS